MFPLRRYPLAAACLCLALLPWAGAAPEGGAARADRYGDPLPEGATARLGTTRIRPGTLVCCLAFSPDGKLLASGGGGVGPISAGDSGRVCLWEVSTARLIREVPVPGGLVSRVLFTPDSQSLVAGSPDGSVRHIEIATGKELAKLQGHRLGVMSLALSRDGKTLAVASSDPVIRLWDLASGKELRQLVGHQGAVSSVAFAPEDTHVASGGNDGTVRLWEVAGGKEVRQFTPAGPARPAQVNAVAFAPDGKVLATGGWDRPLSFWEVATGKELRRTEAAQSQVRSLAFAPGGKFLAAAHNDRTVRLWGVASGKELRHWEGHSSPATVAFSPDGKTIASGGYEGTIRLWDAPADRELHVRDGHSGAIQSLAFMPDGKRLVSVGLDTTARLWDLATGKEVERVPDVAGTVSVAAAADGRIILVPGGSSIHFWKPGAGKEVRTPAGLRVISGVPALSHDGKSLAVPSADRQIQLWNIETLQEVRQLKGGQNYSTSVVFSADSRLLAAAGGDSVIRVWHAASGTELRQLPTKGTVAAGLICFSPDGRCLATAGAEVRVWEIATGQERLRSERPQQAPVSALGFSADGRLLVLGMGDGTLAVRDLATGVEVGRYPGHRGAVRRMVASPDGKALATGGSDTTVLIWEAATLGKECKPLAAELQPGEVERLWKDLADADGAKGRQAIWALAAAPRQAVPLMKEQLRPRAGADPKRIMRLIAELDDDSFAVRERASTELAGIGQAAETALQRALEGTPSAEVKRRVNDLLEKIKQGGVPSDRVRTLRATEVLEHIGNGDARQVLESLAGGGDDPLAQDAKAALERLAKRSAPAP